MTTLDELVEAAAERGASRVLDPYLGRISKPAVLTYTLGEAAAAIGVSPKKVQLLLEGGLLPRVPHVHTILIPRIAVEAFVLGADPTAAATRALDVAVDNVVELGRRAS